MRGTSSEETRPAKEAYERFSTTHKETVCAYRADFGGFTDTQFKEAIQIRGQQISYCGVGSQHQKIIVERNIKELTLIS